MIFMLDTRKAKLIRGEDGELRLDNFYTPLSEAKKEIWRRWNDKELREKINKILKSDILDSFGNEPRAVFCRYVFSPNFEFNYFLSIAKMVKLKPLALQYSDDKLVAKNTPKYHLCKMFFYNGDGKKFGDKIDTLKIVNLNKWEGEKLNNVQTLHNENLVKFHNNLLKKSIGEKNYEIFDFSDWFNEKKKAFKKYYYLHYLSLFIRNGILFENFLTNDEELLFTKNKVLPSFNKVQEIFGVKPLIFPLNSFKSEESRSWYFYPEKTKGYIDNL
jgi:hypothetical protein